MLARLINPLNWPFSTIIHSFARNAIRMNALAQMLYIAFLFFLSQPDTCRYVACFVSREAKVREIFLFLSYFVLFPYVRVVSRKANAKRKWFQ